MKYSHSESTPLIERRGPGRPFSSPPGSRVANNPGAPASPRAFSPPHAQILPFKVGIVETEADLQRVQALRERAYGHHLPGLAEHFGKPDPVDRWPDVTIFFAEDKDTGRLVGSARLQCNRSSALQIERSIVLPGQLQGALLGEVTRLTVIAGYVHPVKMALVKALQLYCVAMQISGLVAASRPSLLRQYSILGFRDLFGDDRLAPMAHGGGLDHRILYRYTFASDEDVRGGGHPIDDFVFRTYHPDIDVFGATARVPDRLRTSSPSVAYSRVA